MKVLLIYPEKNIEIVAFNSTSLQERWKFLLLQESKKRTPLNFLKKKETREESISKLFRLFPSRRETKKKEKGLFYSPILSKFLRANGRRKRRNIDKERERFFNTSVFDGEDFPIVEKMKNTIIAGRTLGRNGFLSKRFGKRDIQSRYDSL